MGKIKYGLIDKTGKTVLPFIYGRIIGYPSAGIIEATLKDRDGLKRISIRSSLITHISYLNPRTFISKAALIGDMKHLVRDV